MSEEKQAYAAQGKNPHYKPPINVWHRVEVIAPVGTQFGIIMDEHGTLTIAMRPNVGEDWPHGAIPEIGTTILEGHQAYQVLSDERGPAVGHEFQADPNNPEKCLVCENAPNAEPTAK